MSDDRVKLHVEVSVVSGFQFFYSLQKMCTSPLPFNNDNTDCRSTIIAQIYLDF